MKILTAWLRHYLPSLPVTDRQLADDLTLRGIAVEGVHDLGPGNGHLFEMDITTNRVDAMNHYGIAREAAAIYDLPLEPLDTRIPIGTLVDEPFPVRIDPGAKGLCGRFTAQVVRGVTIAPSTGQVAGFFTLLGQKQISNAVDASNFVLLGMGHPTHAFDLDKIEGGILVRLAHKGEKLKLLDGTERTLEADDLVVADEKKALGLAGVMGGWDSMITPETKNILVEAAWFDQAAVRRSARRHGLHTDASHRFERGADLNAAPAANALVTALIIKNGGKPEGELIDVIDPEVAARTAGRPAIELSVKQAQRYLGQTLDPEGITPAIVHQVLNALGCRLLLHGLDVYAVQLPSWRLDLEREIDLIEEIARVYGYNRFANTLPAPGIVTAHPLAAKEAAVRTRLLALGFSESISSTFVSTADSETFHTPATHLSASTEAGASSSSTSADNPSAEAGAPSSPTASSSAEVGIHASEPSSPTPAQNLWTIPLENPLSEEASLLRPTLIPGMVAMLAHNLNRDVRNVRLFEQGETFTGTPLADGSFIADVHETPQLTLGLTTDRPSAHRIYPDADAPFYELKGAIESLLALFTPAGGPSALGFTGEAPAWLEPGRSATVTLNSRPIAHFGELSASETQRRKLRQPIFLAQLDLAALYELPLRKVTARDLSRFQAVERDFSFTFPDSVQYHTISSSIHALAIPELTRLTPVELWRDPKKYPGVYSHLLRVVFQSHDHTLTEDELNVWQANIISALTGLGGSLRGAPTA